MAGAEASKEESELLELLTRPFVKSLLTVHDTVRTRSYESPLPTFDPNYHPMSDTTTSRGYSHGKKGIEFKTVGLHKSANEPLVSKCSQRPLSVCLGCVIPFLKCHQTTSML